jgi:DNA-binding response OmpR family regulator
MIRGYDEERTITLFNRRVRIRRLYDECTSELQEVLTRWGEFSDPRGILANLLGTQLDAPAEWYARPVMNEGPRTVTWQGRTCRLGPKLLFRLMARLARQPGDCITFDKLQVEVWKSCVSPDAIRKGVQRLKERLIDAGMSDLAKAIKSDRLSYYLDLNGRS